MIVRPAGNDAVAALDQHVDHRAGVGQHLLLVAGELGLERLLERDRLGGDHVHQRPALRAGENE